MEEGPSDHAYLSFNEVAQSGSPVRPLDFPPPIVHQGTCQQNAPILNHLNEELIQLPEENALNVLHRTQFNGRGHLQEEGYWFRRPLREAIYGSVWVAVLMIREQHEKFGDVWRTTDTFVAIKRLSWARVHRLRGRHIEDPLKEVSCLQLIGTDHPNVLGCRTVLQDSDYLYSILPYCDSGDLFDNVRRRGNDDGLDEPEARYWFRQILQARYINRRR